MRRTAFAALLLVPLAGAALATPAAAAATARSSGVQAIHAGPGSFYAIVGKLKDQERVAITDCTWRARWCEIRQLDGGPSGWVPGSYLIGSAAKNAVTPFDFGFDPLFPGGLRPRRDR